MLSSYVATDTNVPFLFIYSASGASVVAIDNKIEQAMVSITFYI